MSIRLPVWLTDRARPSRSFCSPAQLALGNRLSQAKRLGSFEKRVLHMRSSTSHTLVCASRLRPTIPGTNGSLTATSTACGRTSSRAREAGRDPQWYLDAATYLTEKMDRFPVEDYLIDNLDRPADDVAGEALRLAGWLASADPRRSPV